MTGAVPEPLMGYLLQLGTFSHIVKVEEKNPVKPLPGHSKHSVPDWKDLLTGCSQESEEKLIIFNGVFPPVEWRRERSRERRTITLS